MANDPLIDVRRVRRAISNECGDDPERVFAYYMKHQDEMKQSGRFQFVDARTDNAHAAPAMEHPPQS